MSNDFQDEELYLLGDVARFLPRATRTGKRIHRSAIYRWAKRGLKAADGTRVFLEVVKAGGSLATSKEALQRFFRELTRRASLPNGLAASKDTGNLAGRVSAKSSDVERQLDDAGF